MLKLTRLSSKWFFKNEEFIGSLNDTKYSLRHLHVYLAAAAGAAAVLVRKHNISNTARV